MFLLVLFISGCYATAVADVTCNGRDAIDFVFTKTAGTTISKFTLTGCSGQNVDLPADAYTVTGDQYNFSFNPYGQCVTTPVRDPSDASTYNVGITLLAIRGENIAGKDVIKGGDKVALSCRFQSNYQVESDLRTIRLSGEEITGEEFRFAFEMDRTQSDYTTPDDTEIETNQMVFHTIYSTTATQLSASDFTFKPYRIRLQKKNDPDSFFDLFNVGMSTCGYEALNFQMTYNNGQYNFEYSQILLDADLTAEYKLVADLKLCNSDAMSPECTAFDKCEESHDIFLLGPIYPVDYNLIKSAHPPWMRNWAIGMQIKTYATGTVNLNYPAQFARLADVRVDDNTFMWVSMRVASRNQVMFRFRWMCNYNEMLNTFQVYNWDNTQQNYFRFEGSVDPVTSLRNLKVFMNDIEYRNFGPNGATGDFVVSGGTCPEDGAEIAQVHIGNPLPDTPGFDIEMRDFYYRKLQ